MVANLMNNRAFHFMLTVEMLRLLRDVTSLQYSQDSDIMNTAISNNH